MGKPLENPNNILESDDYLTIQKYFDDLHASWRKAGCPLGVEFKHNRRDYVALMNVRASDMNVAVAFYQWVLLTGVDR